MHNAYTTIPDPSKTSCSLFIFVTTFGTFIGWRNSFEDTEDDYYVRDCMAIRETIEEGSKQVQDVLFVPYHRLIDQNMCIVINKDRVNAIFEPNEQTTQAYKSHTDSLRNRK